MPTGVEPVHVEILNGVDLFFSRTHIFTDAVTPRRCKVSTTVGVKYECVPLCGRRLAVRRLSLRFARSPSRKPSVPPSGFSRAKRRIWSASQNGSGRPTSPTESTRFRPLPKSQRLVVHPRGRGLLFLSPAHATFGPGATNSGKPQTETRLLENPDDWLVQPLKLANGWPLRG